MKNAINKRFLNTFLLVGLFAATINLVTDVIQSRSFNIFVILDAAVCFSLGISYVVFKVFRKMIVATLVLIATLLPTVIYLFLVTGGYLYGITITVFIVIGYLSSLLLKSSLRLYIHLLIGTILVSLLLVQCLHPELFKYICNPNLSSILGSGVPFLTIYLLVAFSSATLKDKFDNFNQKLRSRNSEITKRNKKISALNEELNNLNFHLEEQVEVRTSNLTKRNEQLALYSFRNAHNVRGSLARILGLLYLNEINAEISQKEVLAMISKEAKEMDVILRQISEDLYQDIERGN